MIRLFSVVQPCVKPLRSPFLSLGCGICFSKPPANSNYYTEKSSWSDSFSNFVTQGGRNGTRLQTSATILKKHENIERQILEKQDESHSNIEIQHLIQLAELKQIDFDTSVEAGNSMKEFAVQAAKDFGATHVILDSPKKEDQKYVMDNLTCAVLMMSRTGRVEALRGPKPDDSNTGTPSAREYDKGLLQFDENICTVCGHERLSNGGFFSQFSYTELAFATYGFSQKYVLSRSRKRVYKGTLPSGLQIVIRKHFFAAIKEYEFRSLALKLGSIKHENVGTLLGFCSEGYHRFLVYEYVCYQSLNTHLSARSKELTWDKRLKIALGTSKGLQYLHTHNIFGRLRPKNILLTHDFEPQLANFGLTKNPYEDINHSSEARVMKTFEYLAPEYGDTGTDSSITDVYSFGVVLLELLTGRKTLEDTCGKSFLRWARPLLEEKVYMELVDPSIKDDMNLLHLVLIVRVVEKCLSYDPSERCSISEVVTDLTHIIEIQDHSPVNS
ncbi:hypothetical protein QVD17_02904 [Tagetes erecta]|uniref:Protein kinase domain-containing protein n=1 Tax=Tagetes erecta TaxID=13708 RepID=A0AAD8P983_TARER|nr:hypothetical protein QVD17_02904 [Tagetes erecta]